MTENNEDIKEKENEKSKFSKYEINKVVVESYIGKSNINNNGKENIIKNIDNNGPDTSANNNKMDEIKPKQIFSQCPQCNFNLTYHIKTFNLPLLINNKSSLSYLITQQSKKITEIKENKDNLESNSFKKGLAISTSSLFISEGQNLKGMRIHLINNTSKNEYDNVVHKEITNLKNSKNKNDDNVEINLSNNTTDNLFNSLETIKKRWLKYQKEYKFKLSYINNNETVIINKKKYMNELINKVNIKSTSISNNTQEYYLLIKQDRNNKDIKYIHEIISPGTKKEFETSINNFILQNSDNKENNDKINIKILNKSNKRTSQNYIMFSNAKKQSKFNNKTSKTNVEDNNDENGNPKEVFSPIFIFNQNQIKNLFELINKKTNLKKDRKNEQTTSKTTLKNENTKKEKLKNTQKEKIDDLNFNLFPIKVDKFEIIQTGQNVFGGGSNMNNNNIDVSNIALNQSDINTMKQIKQGENEDDYSSRKNKEAEDFGQNTPISLLHEKYFIYAVSKWAKYSAIIPQFQLYVKYSYKAGRPKFDPINLDTTNFTLWIEKIQTKNKRISTVNTNSSSGINKMKTKSNSKINAYKSGESIFLNDTSHNNDQLKRKKSKSKPKSNK